MRVPKLGWWVLYAIPALAALWLMQRVWTREAEPWMPVGGPIELGSSTGPFRLADLRGDVVLVYFGFASCADVCPTTLGAIGAALRSLEPAEAEHVRAVFVSLDPERDSTELLARYAAVVDPRIVGVTGPVPQLRDITGRYGIAWRKTPVDSALGYVIDHASTISVVDPEGELVEQLRHGRTADDVAAAIRRHLP